MFVAALALPPSSAQGEIVLAVKGLEVADQWAVGYHGRVHKCYWPGLTEEELRLAVARAGGETGQRPQTSFRGALYLPGDELVLCLFESSSPTSVKSASERAGMPCERVIETVWVAPHSKGTRRPGD